MAHAALEHATPGGYWLAVVSTAKEAAAALRGLGADPAPVQPGWTETRIDDRFGLVICGVGKANAAGAVGRCFDPDRHAGVISLGVCGALPTIDNGARTGWACEVGDLVLADRAVFADEGVQTPSGFQDIASLGFGPIVDAGIDGLAITADRAVANALQHHAVIGAMASVSICSGTDALADEIAVRTGCVAEAMEGAAAAHAALKITREHARFVELRGVSNRTGSREMQNWNLPAALAALQRGAALL